MEGVRERWGGRTGRVFSRAELEALPGGAIAIAWAAREATVKALGVPGMFGSPLSEMAVRVDGSRLIYTPGPKAREQLRSVDVDRVHLALLAVGGVVLVLAAAQSAAALPDSRVAWGCLAADKATRSQQARRAAQLALGRITATATPELSWSGGGSEPPALEVRAAGETFRPAVSLTHDAGLAAAIVGLPVRGTAGRSGP